MIPTVEDPLPVGMHAIGIVIYVSHRINLLKVYTRKKETNKIPTKAFADLDMQIS